MSIFAELKRRNVFRVGIAYLVLGWVLLQVTDVVVPILDLPGWVARLVLLLLGLGFPVVLIFAWAFELTPEGLKREKDVDRSQSITTTTGRKLDRTIIVILAAAVVLLVLDRYSGPDPESAASESAKSAVTLSETPVEPGDGDTSVAVLPFVNMSDDAENEYFSDGISEELLNVLVRVQGLRVPSRTSSFTFKGSNKKIAEIGKELQVDHVLEGSVRKAGDRIRVTAQLIDVRTDTHIWSETFTREVDDIFAVQDEIAHAIVNALQVSLTGAQKQSLSRHSTDNVEAYNKYLLGRHLWNQRTVQSLAAAVQPLREAVELDPRFDQAWAALADTYALFPEYRVGSIAEYVPLGREAAEQALAINKDSARALTTLAYLKAMYAFDFDGANADFERAVELEPGYATGHQWYGEILAVQRRTDEAMEQLRLAMKADPLAAIVVHVAGWILMYADRQEEALTLLQAAREMDPSMPPVLGNLETLHLMRGEYAQARLVSAELGRILSVDQAADRAVIDAMENPALKQHALDMLQQWKELPDGAMDRALYLALLGEDELAMDNLQLAFEKGDPYAVHMNRMSLYDPLRDDPRFRALLTRMNLWP